MAPLARYQWAVCAGLIFFVASTITRVTLLLTAGVHTGARLSAVTRSLAAGAIYDVLVALWLSAPVMLYLTVTRRSRFSRRTPRTLRRLMLGGAVAIAIVVAVSELIFFDEFDGRFNFVAVDYLLYPTEVVTNIWESYHVAWALTAIAVIVALGMFAARPMLRRLDELDGPALRWRLPALVGYAGALLLLSLAVSPSLAHVSDNRVVNEIASNGYYAFWGALLGRDAAYEGLYATRPDSVVMSALPELVAAARRCHCAGRPGPSGQRRQRVASTSSSSSRRALDPRSSGRSIGATPRPSRPHSTHWPPKVRC